MRRLLLIITCILCSLGISAQDSGAKFKTLSSKEFAKVAESKDTQVVDIRPADKYKEGHIDRAVNIVFKSTSFDSMIAKLSKNKVIAIYCHSGARSKVIAQKLANSGYKVVLLKNGYLSWLEEMKDKAE